LSGGSHTLALKLKPGDRVGGHTDRRHRPAGRRHGPRLPEAVAKQNPPLWSAILRRVEAGVRQAGQLGNRCRRTSGKRLREAFAQTPEYRKYASQVAEISVPRPAASEVVVPPPEDVPAGEYTLFPELTGADAGASRATTGRWPRRRSGSPSRRCPAAGATSRWTWGVHRRMPAVNHELKPRRSRPRRLTRPRSTASGCGCPTTPASTCCSTSGPRGCGPCIAEHKTLRALHDAHAAGGRFVNRLR